MRKFNLKSENLAKMEVRPEGENYEMFRIKPSLEDIKRVMENAFEHFKETKATIVLDYDCRLWLDFIRKEDGSIDWRLNHCDEIDAEYVEHLIRESEVDRIVMWFA